VDAFDSENVGVKELARYLEKWQSDITKLMDWLDWAIWLRCNPACGPEEVCYIPTWPWGYTSPRDEGGSVELTPRCIEAVAPYTGLYNVPPRPSSIM